MLDRSTIPAALQLRVGDTVEVSLDAQTGAGYTWNADTSGHVDLTHSFSPGPDIGSPAAQIFRITALTPGDEQLRFVYCRAWQADHVLDEFEVVIHIA